MSTIVHIPDQLQELFGAAPVEEVAAPDLANVITALDARYPGMAERILEPDGQPRRHVNLFVNHEHMSTAGGMHARLDKGDVVWIIPAVAGG